MHLLRLATSERPDDPQLAELVGELSINSPEFAGSGPPIRSRNARLRLPDDPGQRMIFHGAEPGSESQRRLRLLASLIAQPTG